jgi:hypothetical protein
MLSLYEWVLISQITSIYLKLVDLLNDVLEHLSQWVEYDKIISFVIQAGLKKFKKYYKLINNNTIYYIISILNPWIKGA